ncbi:TRAP transporter TAXI family solute receptor [Malaciobacter marinus]|jgi:TRAP transporter TAXI family solute receptor|uniref:TRAP transporter TAXI family solute receptor n=1 Tax=Malaciobacter marinus TaxID=505249 RepID=A0AB36ZUR6_9BACT|nr:TAXI family TRAP transporter solute-binding subunit [Malaciobacter marinus]PPK61015.1 TRAP transporter TAXI family solute receptor [Malaciobacter marinus]SKB49048.1 TRAP transporter solute receptor, TAXI family [Malaciobacter marinus]
MKNKFFTVSIPILLLIIASFYITSKFVKPAPKKEITIATGSKNGSYYETAMLYKKLLEKEKVKVNILTSKGSIDNIKLLNENKADIAFIQNGTITTKDTDSIKSIASVYYEPLWVFYKNEGYKIDYIIQLITKNISIGEIGSGTYDLASKILKDNGLSNENSTISNYSSSKAKQLLLDGKIDAMFAVTSHNSQVVKSLLANPNINVLNFKRAKAYSRKYSYLESLTLYEGTLDLYKNLPDENINLLATTANLVVRSDFSQELIRILLKKVKEVHKQKDLFAKQGEFPNLKNMKLELHEEAKIYFENGDTWLEKIFPYWIAANIDRLKIFIIPLLTLLFPLFKGVLPLYQWSMRSKIYKWYDEVKSVEIEIGYLNKEQLQTQLEKLQDLQDEISKETKVPLSFMGEYYNLIMHINMLEQRIKTRLKLI